MLNTLKLHFSQNKSLLIATLISLLLHTLFLSKFALTLPEINEDHQALEMRLVNLPATQKTTPAPVKEEIQKPEPKVEQTSSKDTQATDTHDITPVAETPEKQESTPAGTLQNTPEIGQSTAETPPEPADTADLTGIAKEQKAKVYKYVETEFEVHRGSDAAAAGVARIVFSIKEDNTYRLTNLTEAKGLASLFFGKLQQVSEGAVTENGLVPYYYLYQYGNDEKKMQHADFLWSDGTLEMFSAKGKKTEKLTPGIQDFLSFMYQFMFVPPLENNTITMTNGKSLRTYTYSFQGEELIQTKFSELNTIHLLKQGDEEEKTELWLAVDYQNLPVKIRKTEKDGSVIEQTATKIYTITP